MRYFQPPNFKEHNIAGIFTEKIPKERVLRLKGRIVFPEQIHSCEIIKLSNSALPPQLRADGVITLGNEYIIGVQTADCLPILIADRKKRLVSAVHAGWRGTIGGILSRAMEQILDEGIFPEDLIVAIGPHIQSTCYEVGADIVDLLQPYMRKPPFLFKSLDKYFLNLTYINLSILFQFKVPRENIWISSECTHCLPEKYYSYRRERNYLYTQLAIISLKNNLIQTLDEYYL